MHFRHGTSLLSTPLPLCSSIITLGKKIDDEKTLLLKKIWLRRFLISRKQRNTWKKTCKWKIISRDKKTYLQIMIDKFSLTPNKWDIQPSVTWSSRNMDEIFDLKFHLSYVRSLLFVWNPSMHKQFLLLNLIVGLVHCTLNF